VQQEHCTPTRRIARDRARAVDDPVTADLQSRRDFVRQPTRRPAALPEKCAEQDGDGDQ
jgi:hypothetical protein